MSPLARIRQVAACLVFASLAGWALGATEPTFAVAGPATATDASRQSPDQATATRSARATSTPADQATATVLAEATPTRPTQATATSQVAQPPPQVPAAHATPASQVAQLPSRTLLAQATAASQVAQLPSQTLLAQATAASQVAQPPPQTPPAQATPASQDAQPPSQTPPAQATPASQDAQPPSQTPPAQPVPTPPPAQPATPVQLAPNATARIARSALLSVTGTATADALRLSIRRVSDNSVVSGDDVTVAIDGKIQSVTHDKSGAYELPINDLRGDGARDVDVTVGHDGIREIVSGKVSVADAGSASSLLADHKQIAWWILNIVIVLIAATAISRRKG